VNALLVGLPQANDENAVVGLVSMLREAFVG